MAALDQYIQLYNAHRDTLDDNSAPALNRLRPAAAKVLADAKMPVKGDEDFEATDLESVFADDYGININRIDLGANPADAFRCEVPNMSTCLFFLANDVFSLPTKRIKASPKALSSRRSSRRQLPIAKSSKPATEASPTSTTRQPHSTRCWRKTACLSTCPKTCASANPYNSSTSSTAARR